MRKTKKKSETLIIVCNFANISYKDYIVGVPYQGLYKEVLCSQDKKFGGTGVANSRVKHAEPKESDDMKQSIKIQLAPLSVSIFEYREEQ